MEHYKISKLLNYSTVSKLATKECIEVNDLSSDQYYINKKIRFKTSIPRSCLWDYSDAYIVVTGIMSVTDTNNDCNWTGTHNHLVRKRTLNHLDKLVLVFVCQLNGCGFESSCSHFNFRFLTCFEQGASWHSGNYRV